MPRARNYMMNAIIPRSGICNALVGSSVAKAKNINCLTGSALNTSLSLALDNSKLPQSPVQPILSLEDNGSICYVCQKKEVKRSTSSKNKLIKCLACDRNVHRLCIKTNFEDWNTLSHNYTCDFCLSCCVCNTISDVGFDNEVCYLMVFIYAKIIFQFLL